jgi:hypothetical protein
MLATCVVHSPWFHHYKRIFLWHYVPWIYVILLSSRLRFTLTQENKYYSNRQVSRQETEKQRVLSYVVVMRSSDFWDITPWGSSRVNRWFIGTCDLRLQSLRCLILWPCRWRLHVLPNGWLPFDETHGLISCMSDFFRFWTEYVQSKQTLLSQAVITRQATWVTHGTARKRWVELQCAEMNSQLMRPLKCKWERRRKRRRYINCVK